MTREEFYKLTDILNSEVLGNFMHGGEADELIAMFEEAVEHSNILEQEEPVSEECIYNRTLEERQRSCKFCSAACQVRINEEPVSEDLEGAAQEYVTKEGYLAGLHYNSMVRSFKAGAEWYASHNTKLPDNLLLAARKASIDMCNIDDKYLDEYPYHPIAEEKFIEGAKWQEKQMMAKAVDGDITFDYYGNDDKTYGCIAHNSFCLEDFGLKDRDKVKMILIKE